MRDGFSLNLFAFNLLLFSETLLCEFARFVLIFKVVAVEQVLIRTVSLDAFRGLIDRVFFLILLRFMHIHLNVLAHGLDFVFNIRSVGLLLQLDFRTHFWVGIVRVLIDLPRGLKHGGIGVVGDIRHIVVLVLLDSVGSLVFQQV